jgi:hypothetical protein
MDTITSTASVAAFISKIWLQASNLAALRSRWECVAINNTTGRSTATSP